MVQKIAVVLRSDQIPNDTVDVKNAGDKLRYNPQWLICADRAKPLKGSQSQAKAFRTKEILVLPSTPIKSMEQPACVETEI